MINNINRIGKFTASQIGNLMCEDKKGGFGKPALTYIAEKNMERRLQRSLQTEITSRATSWGNILESIAFEKLPMNYKITSTETIVHPDIPYLSGSPDGVKFDSDGKVDAVFDLKNPWTLKSFCTLIDSETIDGIRENHSEGDMYYYQLVANAILTGANYAELIVYMPYQEDIEKIKEATGQIFEAEQNKVAWLNFANDNDLPYLIRGGHYTDLNIIRFKVTQEAKDLLTAKVKEAGKMLIKIKEVEQVPEKYNPTEEQKQIAQDKIRFMKELKKKMSTKLVAA